MSTTSSTVAPAISRLILGWKMNEGLEPEYWLDANARPGAQPETALVNVSADGVGSHTAIIAQSGSGKSFFLGRFIEELLLHTRCRCLVFDPNSDFRKVNEAKDEKLWAEASYDKTKGKGRLPHESKRVEFEIAWSKIPKLMSSGEEIKVSLPLISAEFLSEGLETTLRTELYHCHGYVRALAPLVHLRNLVTKRTADLVDEAERIFRESRGKTIKCCSTSYTRMSSSISSRNSTHQAKSGSPSKVWIWECPSVGPIGW